MSGWGVLLRVQIRRISVGGEWNFPGGECVCGRAGEGGVGYSQGRRLGFQEAARSGRAGRAGMKGNPFFSWPLPALGPGFRGNSPSPLLWRREGNGCHRGDLLGTGWHADVELSVPLCGFHLGLLYPFLLSCGWPWL